MFERFTQRALRALFHARRHTGRVGGPAIGPEHLVLGLMSGLDDDGSLALVDVETAARIRVAMEQAMVMAPSIAESAEIPFGAATKTVLNRADLLATELGHAEIDAEHLLLAMLAESRWRNLLAEHGVSDESVRAALVRKRGGPPPQP